MDTSSLSPEIVLLLLALVAGIMALMRGTAHTEVGGNRSDTMFLVAVGAVFLLGISQLLS